MQLDPHNADYKEAMSFIAKIFHEENCNYGVLAIVPSTLSAILPNQKTFGQDEIVGQMMKGVFKLRLSLPKYRVTYNLDVILKYLNQLPKNEQLNLEVLTKKLATVLFLLSRQRSQSIQKCRLDYASFQNDKCEFYIPTVLKTSRPGRHQEPLIFTKILENTKICITACIDEYKKRTLPLRNHLTRNDKQFIISYNPISQSYSICYNC